MKTLTFYVPDTRGVDPHYGKGNPKIGLNVHSFSRLPGHPTKQALGAGYLDDFVAQRSGMSGTCPGATVECQAICYAARPVIEGGPVMEMWRRNSITPFVPPIPEECTRLRIHVSGDFDSPAYIQNWIARLTERPDVTAWAYTRSWRVDALLPDLERLRALPNIQLFASMDPTTTEMPPQGWRRSWIKRAWDTAIAGPWPLEYRLTPFVNGFGLAVDDLDLVIDDMTSSYVCPEETGRKANCEACRYCFDGQSRDVSFLEH